MTKAELIQALAPYTDETEVMIGSGGRWWETDRPQYAQRLNGDGCLVLHLGAQILLQQPEWQASQLSESQSK